jgi:hypothetical protein
LYEQKLIDVEILDKVKKQISKWIWAAQTNAFQSSISDITLILHCSQ